MLEGTIKAEFHIQALKDRVVLTHALAVVRSAIFAAIESGLDAVTEEVEGGLHQVVGHHVVDLQQLGCLCLLQHRLPKVGFLLQQLLGTTQAMLLDELFGNLAEHDAARHALCRHADAEALASPYLIVILHGFQTFVLYPLATFRLQLGQFYRSLHQRQQVGYLLDALLLAVGQHIGFVFQRCEGVVGCAGYGNTALETVGIVGHHTIQGIRRTAHADVPQQMFDMHVDGLGTLSLTVVL